jgi:hypothetical protein
MGRRDFKPLEIRPSQPVKMIESILEAGCLKALALGSSLN